MVRRFPGLCRAALGVLVAAMAATIGEAQDPAPAPVGTIEGTVFDSLLTQRPLRGATVYVVGTTLAATTDDRGRFAIEGVPEGTEVALANPETASKGGAPKTGASPVGVAK